MSKDKFMSEDNVAGSLDGLKKHSVSASGSNELLCDELKSVRVVFGLVNQGHIPTIEEMLDRHCKWDEINSVIGWAGDAAQESYIRYLRKRLTEQDSAITKAYANCCDLKKCGLCDNT